MPEKLSSHVGLPLPEMKIIQPQEQAYVGSQAQYAVEISTCAR